MSYTVEGGEASETAPELKPVTEASFEDATAEVTITNTLKTFDIAASKHWIGDSATEGQDLRPDAVELTLQRKVRGEDDSAFTAVPGVTPAWLNADTAHNSWVASWTDLPAYAETADGRMDYVYRVVETKVPDNYEVIYTGEGGAIPGIDAAEALENDLAQVEITNKLKPVSITLTKKWLGDEILYELTRPEDLTVKLYRSISGGAAEEVTADADGAALDLTAFTGKDTGVWSITIDNLPVYDANRKPYTYWMEETVPDAYAAKDDGVTARVDATEHIGDTISLEMENTLRTTGLTARKTWSNDNDWTDAYRPATLMLTLEYTIAQNPAEDDWTKADALVIAATPRSAERTETVSGDEIAVYTWEYLPAYILTGDNSHAAVTYRVKETVVPYGYEATYSDDDEGDKIVHNALEICELKVVKTWNDQNNYYLTRPESITVILQQTTDEELTVDWENTRNNDGEMTMVLSEENGWQGTFTGLPVYDPAGQRLYYRAMETEIPVGYESEDPVITLGEDDPSSTCEIINDLLTVWLEGTKTWDDWDDANEMRPDQIELTVLNKGEVLVPQPEITFTEDAENGNLWHYVMEGLPLIIGGEPAEYTLRESYVENYRTFIKVGDKLVERSEVSGEADQDGNLTGLDFINTLRCYLEIDNMTINAAVPGVTNAGGFVSVGDNAVTNRDIDPYRERMLYVTWKTDRNWHYDEPFRVMYQEHGEDFFRTIEVAGMNDISALYERYPDARVETLSDGSRRLILADKPADMPLYTRVEVKFVPTIIVENTTVYDYFGHVSVENGDYHYIRDHMDYRYEERTVYGKAKDGCQVAIDHLQIGNVGDVSSYWRANWSASELELDDYGYFSVDVQVELAGKMPVLTITGKVTVLDRDEWGNPTWAKITLDKVPACLDIGIPFERVDGPSDIAKTGDPLLAVLGVGGVSAIALLAVLLISKRKRKQN